MTPPGDAVAMGDGRGMLFLREDVTVHRMEDRGGPQEYLVDSGTSVFAVNERVVEVIQVLRQKPSSLTEARRLLGERFGRTVAYEKLANLVFRELPRGLFEAPVRDSRPKAIALRVTLLTARAISPLTARLTWVFRPIVAIAVVLAGSAVAVGTLPEAHKAVRAGMHWPDLVLLYLGLAASGLLHELGHAAACRRYGAPHGSIGMGLYLVFPVFYADVTRVWRLPRTARCVVDVAGIYFQLPCLAAAGVYGWITGSANALRLVWLILFTILQNLNPIFKMDGYWLFADLAGLRNLHRKMGEAFRDAIRRALRLPPLFPSGTAVEKRLLAVYCGLVLVYWTIVTDFLIKEVGRTWRHLPPDVWPRVAALVHGSGSGGAGFGSHAGALLGVLAWPALLAAACAVMLYRSIRSTAAFLGEVLARRSVAAKAASLALPPATLGNSEWGKSGLS